MFDCALFAEGVFNGNGTVGESALWSVAVDANILKFTEDALKLKAGIALKLSGVVCVGFEFESGIIVLEEDCAWSVDVGVAMGFGAGAAGIDVRVSVAVGDGLWCAVNAIVETLGALGDE